MTPFTFNRVGDVVWELPPMDGMTVPARIYATEKMIDSIMADNAPQQVVNVAHLPGIVKVSLAMPDIHWGYGFPIGGVAAFATDKGVVSPGGVGYDINCGVRLMTCKLSRKDVEPRIRKVVDSLFQHVPTGVGASGVVKVSTRTLEEVALNGARWAVQQGFGTESDLEYIEENGRMSGCNPNEISARAYERGRDQLGTLGSGNHFLEIGYVSEVYDEKVAAVLGLYVDQITVIVHCGSRGFGYQVCDDFLKVMDKAVHKYGISLPDRQLACAPLSSPEAKSYLAAMRGAVNYAFANRQVIAARMRMFFAKAMDMSEEELGMRTVYEVAHNIAKLEQHEVDGKKQTLCVHRKGATRAFPPKHPDIPAAYSSVGQPVLIPGDMGRTSYVLTGTARAMAETFGSTCHGAGRMMSRTKAKKAAAQRNIAQELASRGIYVRGQSRRTLDEEISEAYKDVADVVEACVQAGISKKIAQLKPLGCIKG